MPLISLKERVLMEYGERLAPEQVVIKQEVVDDSYEDENSNTEMSMMNSGATAEDIEPVSLIKREDDEMKCFQPCSPSDTATSTIYSPTTTIVPNDIKFCDGEFVEVSNHIAQPSPESPDHQYCSSTTQSLGSPMFNPMEEGMKQDDLPRRLCLVCGDVASGFHYGVASCEACKAFFKRTIQGNIEYTCPAANDCEINKRRRKACQACRFQKCLHMGMLKEGVRLDRVRGGRQKYRRNPDTHSMQNWPSVIKTSPSLEDNKMLVALNLCEPELLCTGTETFSSDPGLRVIEILSDLYDRELVHIIGWAKQIPGFTELSLNDQMRLLQSTWAEILTLTVCYRSLPQCNGKLRFAVDFVLDEKNAKDSGVLEIHSMCLHIVEKLSRLSIAREEYLLLKGLVLANSDIRLEDTSALKKFRDTILSSLCDCVYIIRPNTCINHIQNLLLCLPSLRQADHLIRKFWSKVNNDGIVIMNKLFIEMLESGPQR